MTGTGVSHGCISVINGIVNGTGAVIGIALETVATYTEGGDSRKVIIEGEKTGDRLAKLCVKRTLEHLGAADCNYTLTIRSQIPPSRGLKSSSSVCNAVIKAVLDKHGADMNTLDMIKLGVECAKEAGVTVTGSFDDACGCEIGGFVMTYNYENRILEQRPVRKDAVVLCIPGHVKRKVPKEEYQARSRIIEQAIALCETDIYSAMTLNGRAIAEVTRESGDLIDIAIQNGAIAAGVSGTGPAVGIICSKEDAVRIAQAMPCETIITEVR